MLIPAEVPQRHAGICCGQNRFIYFVAGQLGPRCHPATSDCFGLDTRTQLWERLPPLPEARYSPIAAILDNRLHVLSGMKADRWTSARNHWSIAIAAGKALEKNWRSEPPSPRGGPHGASATIRGKFYVFGGQDGDMRPVAGDSRYKCDHQTPLETL